MEELIGGQGGARGQAVSSPDDPRILQVQRRLGNADGINSTSSLANYINEAEYQRLFATMAVDPDAPTKAEYAAIAVKVADYAISYCLENDRQDQAESYKKRQVALLNYLMATSSVEAVSGGSGGGSGNDPDIYLSGLRLELSGQTLTLTLARMNATDLSASVTLPMAAAFDIDNLTRRSSPALSDDIAVTSNGTEYRVSLTAIRSLIQRVYALEGGTGITVTGTGTTANPWHISSTNPFTETDEAKLDGIESGAQVNVGEEFTTADHSKLDGIQTGAQENPPHSLSFAAIDGDVYPANDLLPGEIGFYSDSSTQLQPNVNINTATILRWPFRSDGYNEDPLSPLSTHNTVNLEPFSDDLVDNNGDFIVTINQRGQAATVNFTCTALSNYSYVSGGNTIATGYEATVSHVDGGFSPSSGGVGWQVSIHRTGPVSLEGGTIGDLAQDRVTGLTNDLDAKLNVDGSNVTAATQKAVQGHNETNVYRMTRVTGEPSAVGQFQPPVGGSGNASYVPPTGSEIDQYEIGDWVTWGAVKWEITAKQSDFAGNVKQIGLGVREGYTYSANDLPAVNASRDMDFIGSDVHRGQLANVAFVGIRKIGDISIATNSATWIDVATGLDNGAIISASGRAQWTTQTANWYAWSFGPIEFGEIETTATWAALRGSASGNRAEFQRSGTTLQMRLQGPAQNLSGNVYRYN